METMPPLGSTLRIFHPAPGIVAFYDGRIAGRRAYSELPNWLDDGAYSLGICSYVIVDGPEALVYDTHISLTHADLIREMLQTLGVRSIRVVLSHWHDDHVAGNEVFADCEILAHHLTAQTLEKNRIALEKAIPPIKPLIMPNSIYEDTLEIKVGNIAVELRHADIHSLDGTVLFLPESSLLLAGDTLEDTVTYVDEPHRLDVHLKHLEEMASWKISRILPNHGSPDVIESGGYGTSLITATRNYVKKLQRCRTEPTLAAQDLRTFCAEDLAAGAIFYFPGYEEVHQLNVQAVTTAQ